MPTAVVIGAGPGLGLAVARRFGREGYRVALISRSPERQASNLAHLAGLGIHAAAFQADVRDTARLSAALDEVVETLGEIDVVYYGPSPHGVGEEQKPIDAVSGDDIREAMAVVFPAADVVAKVLPSMRERKTGAFLFTSAISAVLPVPALGAMTVPAAAARSYAATLNAALAPEGIHAGVLLIGGLIDGSDIAAEMGGAGADATYLLDPDRIADAAWEMAARRGSAETLVMPGRQGLGVTALLIGRLLRMRRRNAKPRRSPQRSRGGRR